jgi:hypothetical protein
MLMPTCRLACLVLLAGTWTFSAAAQAGDDPATADSARVHESARRAQARFERVRQQRLPWTSGGGGACDEYVGRYCVRHDRGDDAWVVPREHRDVTEARNELLAELRRASEQLPSDEWVLGQRVSYQLDAGRSDDALVTARGCVRPDWWCDALAGLVHHERAETPDAERRFAAALERMPPDERRRWSDAGPVLSQPEARELERFGPARRDSILRVLWWLADPLWMRPGNDRRTEQYARLVRARIADGARTPEGVRWGRDMEELLLRFGWPAGWERRASGGLERRVQVVTHRAAFGRELIPPLAHASEPWRLPPEGWEMTPRVPVTEYAPVYARIDGAVDHQLAVFPDGDSVTIAAVFSFTHDSVMPDATTQAALVMGMPGWTAMDSSSAMARRAVRSVRVPKRDLVASLEVMVSGSPARAARARFGAPLARRDSSAIVLSDPVLIAANAAPLSRAHAVDHMLLPREASRADSVGVYFEARRLAPDVPVRIQVMLVPEPGGSLRRLGESLGLVSPRSAVRLEWEEPPPADGALTRAVTLGFAGVPQGEYVLHLIVRQDAAWGASQVAVRRQPVH